MKKTYVPPHGNIHAKLAICGEQPGVTEVRRSQPFVGPAGQGLDECLTMAKIPKHTIYLTNVIKDLDEQLSSYINLDEKGNYSISKNGYQYINELGEELSRLNLNAIVACGNIALLALTNRVGITKWRGSVIESTIVPGLKVIPTFHPATFIPPKFNFLNKPLIVEDLLKSLHESEFKEIRRTPRNVSIRPSYEQSIGALNHCYEIGLKGVTIDIDIEVINDELDCFSLCWTSTESISIPLRDNHGDYFDINQEYEVMVLLARIIQCDKISKRGANFIFDTQYLFHKYGMIPRGELHCTQIAQKTAFPDFNAGLDFVTSMHTDIPYYKADGKKWMKMGVGTWEEWWNYNGMDSISTNAAHPQQMQALISQGNIPTYNRQRKLIRPLIYMSERGIKIDVAGIIEYKKEEQTRLNGMVAELHKIVGYPINQNSPQQLMKYFYGDLKINPYTKRNLKNQTVTTVDVDALKRIARRGFDAARIMLDIRSVSKRISTYMNIDKVSNDGRYHSSYNPVGAKTGRLSSSETIDDKGGNQQNWPHDLLRFFKYDEGYMGYSMDLAQIENRIVAHVGGIISMIEAFNSGVDLHKLTASIIFSKSYSDISDEEGSSDLGDGRQSERYWGKKGNHAINYDVGDKTFALKNEIPETEAKYIIEKIHKGYPQIRSGYHQTIQNMLKNNRMVTNLMGRSRLFLGPIIPSYPSVPKHACLNTYREAYAQLPQSTVADKINEHGINYIYYNQHLFKPLELLTQIHDSIVFQIPLSIPWAEHARMVLLLKKSLEQPLEWHGTKFITPADLSIGFNMFKKEMKELKSKSISDDIDGLADQLKTIHGELIAKCKN